MPQQDNNAISQTTHHKRMPLLASCATVFLSSFCIMVIELVAARLLARYLGSSLYTWTAVIGVILGGITVGNYVGGWIADHFPPARALAALFGLCSFICVITIMANTLVGGWKLLWHLPFPLRAFMHVALVFFLPSGLLGAISPVVAKMALDRHLATGKTIGSIYAWSAAGSIAGTFAAGYWLIASVGSIAIIWIVAAVLLILAVLYCVRLWMLYLWLPVLVCTLAMGMGPWHWAKIAGARLALRDAPNSNLLYEDESQYCYIAVNRVPGRGDIRDFVQDKLLHSRINMDEPLDLQYFYTRIYAAVTEQFGRGKDDPAVLVIGGGGYVFPRYIKKVWPSSSVEVAEIDPGVTRAATEAFGLEKNTPIKTIQMDGRNYIDQLLERNASTSGKVSYNFIYLDAVNDYSVPFQLTTREFNEKIARLLAEDGVYLVNLIDVFDDGLFLGAIVRTMDMTFPFVSVVTEGGVPRSHRNTFVIIASKKHLDVSQIDPLCRKKGAVVWLLNQQDTQTIRDKNPNLILTDDYAPVENLLAPVVLRKTAYDLAEHYFRQARKFFEEAQYEKSVERYQRIIERAPSMAIKAYNDMAVAQIKLGRWSQAADALDHALAAIERERLDIYTGDIHYNLAVVLSRTGKTDQAAAHFQTAIDDFQKQLLHEPKNAELYLKIGKSLASMAKIKEAEEYFIKALELNPADVACYLELAWNLELQKRPDEAISVLKRGIGDMLHHDRKDDARELEGFLESIKARQAKQQQ
jgi:spermidine synthase/Tfp pilus assembly protein PilF